MRKNLSYFQEINEALYLDNNFSRKNKRESVFYLNLCPYVHMCASVPPKSMLNTLYDDSSDGFCLVQVKNSS